MLICSNRIGRNEHGKIIQALCFGCVCRCRMTSPPHESSLAGSDRTGTCAELEICRNGSSSNLPPNPKNDLLHNLNVFVPRNVRLLLNDEFTTTSDTNDDPDD